jgi:hypothetical protein
VDVMFVDVGFSVPCWVGSCAADGSSVKLPRSRLGGTLRPPAISSSTESMKLAVPGLMKPSV